MVHGPWTIIHRKPSLTNVPLVDCKASGGGLRHGCVFLIDPDSKSCSFSSITAIPLESL